MSDENTPSEPRSRNYRLDDIDRDILKLQDRVSNLGERVTGLETGLFRVDKSVDELKHDFKTLAVILGEATDKRQDKMLGTFYKMFLIFGFISLVCIISIVSVAGYGLSVRAFGLEAATTSTTSNVSLIPEDQTEKTP